MSSSRFVRFVFSAIIAVVGATAVSTQAQTFTVIQNFSGSGASLPGTLTGVLGRDGNMYSESFTGGTSNAGTVFNASPTGTITVVHNKESGCNPRWLSAGSDGNIYGACKATSSSPNGYIWSLSMSGAFTDLHDFNGSTEGGQPIGPFLATDGNIYGVTEVAARIIWERFTSSRPRPRP